MAYLSRLATDMSAFGAQLDTLIDRTDGDGPTVFTSRDDLLQWISLEKYAFCFSSEIKAAIVYLAQVARNTLGDFDGVERDARAEASGREREARVAAGRQERSKAAPVMGRVCVRCGKKPARLDDYCKRCARDVGIIVHGKIGGEI
jgi:hypothetical protein